VLEKEIQHLLTRPVGRPPEKPIVLVPRLPVSGGELGPPPAGRGEGGVAPGRALPPGGLHRDQSVRQT
jgi:hypothetical protein